MKTFTFRVVLAGCTCQLSHFLSVLCAGRSVITDDDGGASIFGTYNFVSERELFQHQYTSFSVIFYHISEKGATNMLSATAHNPPAMRRGEKVR